MLTFGSKWNLNSSLTCEGLVFDRFIQTLLTNETERMTALSQPINLNLSQQMKTGHGNQLKKLIDSQPGTFIEAYSWSRSMLQEDGKVETAK